MNTHLLAGRSWRDSSQNTLFQRIWGLPRRATVNQASLEVQVGPHLLHRKHEYGADCTEAAAQHVMPLVLERGSQSSVSVAANYIFVELQYQSVCVEAFKEPYYSFWLKGPLDQAIRAIAHDQ